MVPGIWKQCVCPAVLGNPHLNLSLSKNLISVAGAENWASLWYCHADIFLPTPPPLLLAPLHSVLMSHMFKSDFQMWQNSICPYASDLLHVTWWSQCHLLSYGYHGSFFFTTRERPYFYMCLSHILFIHSCAGGRPGCLSGVVWQVSVVCWLGLFLVYTQDAIAGAWVVLLSVFLKNIHINFHSSGTYQFNFHKQYARTPI